MNNINLRLLMQALLKVASYKWYDPVVAPPLPRNKDELRTLRGRGVVGTLTGAATGALLGSMYKDNRLKGGILGAAAGVTVGNVIGEISGSKKILKSRIRAGNELDKAEEARMIEKYTPQDPISRIGGIFKAPKIEFMPENL